MRLLGVERSGGVTEKYYLHTGANGEDCITVETTEDVAPVFDSVKRTAQNQRGDMRLVASIPETVITEMCKVKAGDWGIRPREVFAELMSNETDRAKMVWKSLTQGREYRKLQSKAY